MNEESPTIQTTFIQIVYQDLDTPPLEYEIGVDGVTQLLLDYMHDPYFILFGAKFDNGVIINTLIERNSVSSIHTSGSVPTEEASNTDENILSFPNRVN